MERMQQLKQEASLARQTAAADAAAAEDERQLLRNGVRGRPIFSARHSSGLVTFSLASDDDGGPRDTADEWGSAAEMDVAPDGAGEGSLSEQDSGAGTDGERGPDRATVKRARKSHGGLTGGTVLRSCG